MIVVDSSVWIDFLNGCLPDIQGGPVTPSIAAMPFNPGIDVMGQKVTSRTAQLLLFDAYDFGLPIRSDRIHFP